MPMILVLGGLFVSALFGGAAILDKIDNIQDDTQKSFINLGSMTLIVLGGVAVWYVMKKK